MNISLLLLFVFVVGGSEKSRIIGIGNGFRLLILF